MSGDRVKILEYKYPLAEHVLMQDESWDAHRTAIRKERRAGNTVDADLEAAFAYWRRKLARLVDSVLFNVIMIFVVSLDLGCVIYNQISADETEKDCFGRYGPTEVIIYALVFIFFVVELCIRVMSQGPQSYFAMRRKSIWNWLDTAVVIVACFFFVAKYLEDSGFRTRCPSSMSCPAFHADLHHDTENSIFSEPCSSNDMCEFIPPSPYTTSLDSTFQTGHQLCLQHESVGRTAEIAATVATASRFFSRAIMLGKMFLIIIAIVKNEQSRSLFVDEIRLNISRLYALWNGIRRYKILDYDLDLSYITDRMIAFSAPSSENCYMVDDEHRLIGLNSAEMTARFLGEHHYGRLKIYNFCAESEGDYSAHLFFSAVSRIPLSRSSDAPFLTDILVFCDNMARFLKTEPDTVVAIHCSDGCRRTGVVCACWLLYCGHRRTAAAALQYFANRRYKKGFEDTDDHQRPLPQIPSQIRMVEYLEQLLKEGLPFAPSGTKAFSRTMNPELEIHGLTLSKCGKGSTTVGVCFQIFSQGVLVYESPNPTICGSTTDVDFSPVLVRGEVRIVFFERRKPIEDLGGASYFLQFHSGFVNGSSHILRGERLVFTKNQLDRAHLDTKDKQFDKDMEVEVKLRSFGDQSSVWAHQRLKDQLREQARGQERVFFKGQHIIEACQQSRYLYLIIEGIVVQEIDDKDTEVGIGKTNFAMLFPGDFFGAEGFYARCRHLRHVAVTDSVELIVVSPTTSKDTLTTSPGGLQGGVASFQRTCSIWEEQATEPKCDKFSFERQPEFDRVLAEILCREFHIKKLKHMQRMGFQLVETASITLQESIRRKVIRKCHIPDTEYFLSAHSCDVRMQGALQVSGRIIFMTHYIVFDRRSNANASYVNPTGLIFNVISLSDAYRAGMQVKVVVAVLDGVEYECLCATSVEAESLCAAFKALLSDPHIKFERNLALRRTLSIKSHRGVAAAHSDSADDMILSPTPGIDMNLPPTPSMEGPGSSVFDAQSPSDGSKIPALDIFRYGEVIAYAKGEAVVEEGCQMTRIYRIIKGSVVLQAEGKVKEIFELGALFGEVELLLGRPRAMGRYSAGMKNGCTLTALSMSTLQDTSTSKKLIIRFYAELARKYAEMEHSLLLHIRPHVFDLAQTRVARQAERGDANEDGGSLAQHRVDRIRLKKMLKLRRCGLLRPLNGAALDQISAKSRLISVAEGKALMKQGEELVPGVSDCMYVVLSGKFRVLVQAPGSVGKIADHSAAGGEGPLLQRVDTIAGGDVVGEAAVLGASRVRTATVLAARPCKVAQLSRAVVEGVILANPAVEGLFRDVMKQRMNKRALQRMKGFVDFVQEGLKETAIAAGLNGRQRGPVTVHTGDVLIRQGDEVINGVSNYMYILLSGTMRVHVHVPSSTMLGGRGQSDLLEVEVISSGEMVGETALMTGKPRSATVIAASDCQLLPVAQNTLRALLHSNENMRESLLQIADERMRSNLAARMRSAGRVIAQIAPPHTQRTVQLHGGEVLMRQGDLQIPEVTDGLYVLLSGTMEVLMLDIHGGLSMQSQRGRIPQLVDVIHAGAVIGEAELTSGQPRGATVAAMTDCELVEISRAGLASHLAPGSALRRALEGITEQRDVLRGISAAFRGGSDALAAAAAAAAAVAEARSDQSTPHSAHPIRKAFERKFNVTSQYLLKMLEDGVQPPAAAGDGGPPAVEARATTRSASESVSDGASDSDASAAGRPTMVMASMVYNGSGGRLAVPRVYHR